MWASGWLPPVEGDGEVKSGDPNSLSAGRLCLAGPPTAPVEAFMLLRTFCITCWYTTFSIFVLKPEIRGRLNFKANLRLFFFFFY